ncbi:hypothetical protein FDI69_gp098 [Rhodococcus phage Trina]|uniref:Uncharacterized protein n=1 Tax=Rhodococcus phage Trina TaxID=2027905 RepID=A0A2D1A260_9CAUD|nr:hypothetical protein FDI69_gp098 [Rhodococcus phage Trina]ASZ74912.1 hypothetical protein SEA_TRINA_98 [Rhodococcus phage Trina]
MHDRIRLFSEEGIIADDKYFWRQKDNFIGLLEEKMRASGYVPHLDLSPEWSTSLRDDESYAFKISWGGVFVGKEISLSKDPTAYSDGKLIRIR